MGVDTQVNTPASSDKRKSPTPPFPPKNFQKPLPPPERILPFAKDERNDEK
jgi:hypothetical protein